MIKCEVCGNEFCVTESNHYIARDEDRFGIIAICGGDEYKIYDAVDCPSCGCQKILQSRKRGL